MGKLWKGKYLNIEIEANTNTSISVQLWVNIIDIYQAKVQAKREIKNIFAIG